MKFFQCLRLRAWRFVSTAQGPSPHAPHATRPAPHPAAATAWCRGLVACLALCAAPAWAMTGTVTHVGDGDTVYVRVGGGRPVAVRLHGLDAPERCQDGGPAATAALARRVHRRDVHVAARATDTYGRTVGVLTLDGEDIGEWLVREGHAWSSGPRGAKGPYAAAERSARRRHAGIFAGDPQPPWVFRKAHGACPRAPRRGRTSRDGG